MKPNSNQSCFKWLRCLLIKIMYEMETFTKFDNFFRIFCAFTKKVSFNGYLKIEIGKKLINEFKTLLLPTPFGSILTSFAINIWNPSLKFWFQNGDLNLQLPLRNRIICRNKSVKTNDNNNQRFSCLCTMGQVIPDYDGWLITLSVIELNGIKFFNCGRKLMN